MAAKERKDRKNRERKKNVRCIFDRFFITTVQQTLVFLSVGRGYAGPHSLMVFGPI
jgi:hypothetical protein